MKRIIRKLQIKADNDLQFWPVVVALCVFGGFLLGVILIYLSDHFLLWPALIGLPILVGALIIGLRAINNRFLRRSMQLALVLSLLINAVILIIAYEREIFARLRDPTTATAVVKREKTARPVPELHRQSRIQQELNERVEADTPEPEPDQVEKEETEREKEQPKPQPLPVPKPQETPKPAVVEKQLPSETPPKQARTQSRLSRQTQEVQLRSGVTANTAQLNQQSTEKSPTQQQVELQKRTADNTSQRRTVQQQPSSVVQHTAQQINRTQPENRPQTDSTSAAQLPRAIAERPQVAPAAVVPTPQDPHVAAQTQPQAKPDSSQLAKQTTSQTAERTTPQPTVNPQAQVESTAQRRQMDAPQLPQTARTAQPQTNRSMTAPSVATNATAATSRTPNPSPSPTAQPTAQAAATSKQSPTSSTTQRSTPTMAPSTPATAAAAPIPSPNREATRQPRAPSSTAIASAPQSVQRARATPNSLTSPATTDADVPTPQGPTVAVTPKISPSNTAIERSPASTPSTSVNARSADAPTNAVAQQVPRPSSERTQSDAPPSLNPKSLEQPTPARSQMTAQAPATSVAIESPAPVQVNNSSGQTANQPTPLVMNKATTVGTAGIGRSENLDRFTPTAQGSASAALDSASRPRATQTETGQSFSPHATAQIRRSVADQAAPSATQQATADTVAQLPGATEPSTTNSTTSAVSIDTKATADLGETTASRGNVQVDTGPSRLVPDPTPGTRAAGGGQPQLNFESDSNLLARQDPGGAPSTSIAAATVDELPMAPSGGGGDPSTAELNPEATAITRAESGGLESLSAGPTSSALSGPTANTNTATELALAAASRAEAAEAVPGELSAGGGELDEDEEERRRRLARAALAAGGPATAAPGAITVEVPAPAGGQPATAAPTGPVGPQVSEIARAETSGGAAATAQPDAVQGPQADAGGQSVGEVQIARAEPADGEPGPTRSGGGTGSPARAATGPAFTTNLQADVVEVAGGPSSGVPQAEPLDAQGVEATKLAGGALSATMAGPLGAMSSQTAVSAVGAAVPEAMAGRRATSPADDGPQLASGSNTGSPLPRTGVAGLPPGTLAMADIQLPDPSGGPSDLSPSDATPGGDEVGPVKRDSAGSTLLDIDARAGPGGLAVESAPDAGTNIRGARPDSPVLRVYTDARMIRTNVGGTPGTSTAAVAVAEGYQNRTGVGRGQRGAMEDPETKPYIESGLLFLQRHQSPDGSWSLTRFSQGRPDREYEQEYEAILDSDTAGTGLALLAFLGARATHKQSKYAPTVDGGLRWLLDNQKDNGDLFVRADDDSNSFMWLYSHAIATMALCEAYGMTKDPELHEPAQNALDFLVQSQNPDRGGWRYSPGIDSDTSVTGWVFMAMYSGIHADLNVPAASLERINHWLNLCQKSNAERHLYRYNPFAPDFVTLEDGSRRRQDHGRTPNQTMTAVGLTLRACKWWEHNDAYLLKGADYLLESPPQMGNEQRVRYAQTSTRDAYYWYYATQVMYRVGGERWTKWNARMLPLLLETQTRTGPMAGSWDPIRPTVDRWGPHAGRIYVTTLNLLTLETEERVLGSLAKSE